MNKKMPLIYAIMTTLLMPAITAAQAEHELSAAAEDFIKAGAKTVTSACDVIARKCGDESFRTLEKGFGESNEERRNWRKMQLRSLTVTATFPVEEPTRFYIEVIKIDGPDWPAPAGLDIGTEKAKVIEVLGQPSRMNSAKCAVYASESQVATATFCFRSDRISTISWEYLVD